MINVIISKYPAVSSSYIYRQIEKDIAKGKKSFLIVPPQYTLQTDVDFIETIKANTVMDAKILSFSSLSRYIIDRVGGEKEDILTPTAKVMLITNILNELNDNLELFKDNYQDVDFSQNLADIIAEIKENKFDDEAFERVENSSADKVLKQKFREIKLVYDKYAELTKDKYIDSEDRLSTVVDKLATADFLKGSKFYFDKFDTLTDLQMDFVAGLISLGIDVYISITLDSLYLSDRRGLDLDMFNKSYMFYDRLKNISEIRIKNLDDIKKYSPRVNEEISYLVNNFERYDANPMEDNYLSELLYEIKNIDGVDKKFHRLNNIKLLSNSSTSKEIEAIGLFIKAQIANKNARYRDFAIYLTNSDEYENELIRIFRRNDIPFFMDDTEKLSDNHIIETYMAALRIAIYNYKLDDLSFFLSSNIFSFENFHNFRVATLLNFIDERNIKGPMFTSDKYFIFDEEYYANKFGADSYKYKNKLREYERVNDLREDILTLFKDLYDLRTDNHEVKKIAQVIYEFISNQVFRTGISKYQAVLEERNFLDKYQQNTQAVEKFIAILEQLVAIMGDREISLNEAYNLIESAANNTKIAIIPPTKDHVIVTDLRRSSIANRANNFILGLNSAYFPSTSVSNSIINNKDVDVLRGSEMGLDMKYFDENSEDKEMRNLYKVFSLSDKLFLSFANSDSNGEKLEEAAIIYQIDRLFNGISRTDLLNDNVDLIKYSYDSTKKYVLDLLWRKRNKDDLTDEENDLVSSFLTYLSKNTDEKYDEQLIDTLNLMVKGLNYTNDKKRLDKTISKKLYHKKEWSASEIDKFSRCPYQHFVNYGIKPVEKEIFEVDARDEGNIVHNVFEDISRIFMDEDVISDELDKEVYDKIIAKHMDDIRLSDPRNQITTENIYQKSQENYKRIKKQLDAGRFEVVGVEEKFGLCPDSKYPPVLLEDGYALGGRIDRVDFYNSDDGLTYVRVIDYKTGDKSFQIYNVLNKLDFQLVIYAMSIEEDERNLIPIGSFYLPLKDEIESFNDLNIDFDKTAIEDKKLKDHRMSGFVMDELSDYNIKDPTKANRADLFKIYDVSATNMSSVMSATLRNANILTPEQREELFKFVKISINQMINDINDGEISLIPVKEGSITACTYCSYKGICKIDPSIDEFRYREVDKSMKIENVIDGVYQEEADNE